ncbi:MAG TPA: arginase family protein [Mycobacteriales bacterium]|nr:arginase family protein [Mycobacteriales bacterium]
MTEHEVAPAALPRDPRWQRAGDWLAAGPGSGTPDLAILGVPTFGTSLSKTGAYATPAAVRRALARFSTWCASRRVDLAELSPWDMGDVDDPDVPVEGEWRVRQAARTGAVKSRLLIALGGDNSATYPVMAGAFEMGLDRTGLVTLDAHHDLREGRSNGTPVRDLIAAGLPAEHVVQVGIADWANSKSYADEAAAIGIHIVGRNEVAQRGITECVKEALDVAGRAGGPVYVDLDLDVCDRSVAPACPASLPGGLSAAEVLQAAFLAGQDSRVRAIDVTEVDATSDTKDQRTVRLAAMCVLEAAAGLALRT